MHARATSRMVSAAFVTSRRGTSFFAFLAAGTNGSSFLTNCLTCLCVHSSPHCGPSLGTFENVSHSVTPPHWSRSLVFDTHPRSRSHSRILHLRSSLTEAPSCRVVENLFWSFFVLLENVCDTPELANCRVSVHGRRNNAACQPLVDGRDMVDFIVS